MADGNWIFACVVDERADAAQREALAAIASGDAGGTPAVLRDNLVGDFRGVVFKPIAFSMDALKRSVAITDVLAFAIEGVELRSVPGEPMYIDNTAHPANRRLALARANETHLHGFGLDTDLVGEGNNGHFAPFAWSASARARASVASASSAVVSSRTASAAGRSGAARARRPLRRAPACSARPSRARLDALRLQFQPAPMGAFGLEAGGDEQLHRRVRKNHGADIAPVQHGATRGREAALEIQQRRRAPPGWPRPRQRRRPATGPRKSARSRSARPQRPRRRLGRGRIGRIATRVQHPPADRTIEQAGIQVGSPSAAARRRASVPLPAAAGPSIAMIRGGLHGQTAGRIAAPSAVHQLDEAGETGVDEPGIVDGDRRSAASPSTSAAHRDAVVHMRRDHPAARQRRHQCRARSGRRPRPRPRTPFTDSSAAVAASRSLSLTRSSFRPRIRVVPGGAGGGHRQDRIFVDHARRALRRHVHRAQRAWRRLKIADRFAALDPAVSVTIVARPSRAGEANRPVRSGFSPTAGMVTSRARHQQRRDQRERGRGRIARHQPHRRRAIPAGPGGR